ncbi:hypothetical protein BKA62DRAFT_680481 [Auriculariales sp. MPI-PUGE-AT-0066]|nr:hypothetical protein BKA62DRAFT_680481 [Auriculariales sp. MPI-PUGE-AT-0066]
MFSTNMRSSIVLTSLVAIAAGAALDCGPTVGTGQLRVRKTGQKLGLGPSDGRLYVQGYQPVYEFQPCKSNYVGVETIIHGDQITAIGKIAFNGTCITRAEADGGEITYSTCLTDDAPGQFYQFWNLTLAYNGVDASATGTNAAISMPQQPDYFYYHFTGGHLHFGTYKPSTTWSFVWDSAEVPPPPEP